MNRRSSFWRGVLALGAGFASLGEGMAGLFNITGRNRVPSHSDTCGKPSSPRSFTVSQESPAKALARDRDAIASDWEAVGRDLQSAMDTFLADLPEAERDAVSKALNKPFKDVP